MKERLEKDFDRRVQETTDSAIRDVAHRLPDIVKILESGGSSFKIEIADVAKLLFDAYVRSRKSRLNGADLADGSKSAILAALAYLCDPLGIIPYYTPGIGFVGGAYVLTLCIRRIKRNDRRGYSLIERKLTRILA